MLLLASILGYFFMSRDASMGVFGHVFSNQHLLLIIEHNLDYN